MRLENLPVNLSTVAQALAAIFKDSGKSNKERTILHIWKNEMLEELVIRAGSTYF